MIEDLHPKLKCKLNVCLTDFGKSCEKYIKTQIQKYSPDDG